MLLRVNSCSSVVPPLLSVRDRAGAEALQRALTLVENYTPTNTRTSNLETEPVKELVGNGLESSYTPGNFLPVLAILPRSSFLTAIHGTPDTAALRSVSQLHGLP